jgi:uroporphyrinogen decarboxylase
MSHGTPQDVMNEVKARMATVGAGGGYILSPAHMLNPDIPWENIVAFFDAAEKYGTY